VVDLCDINNDWDYISKVITSNEPKDVDLDESKLSEGAKSIYLEYFKVPESKFLTQNHIDQTRSIEERGAVNPYEWVNYQQFNKCVMIPNIQKDQGQKSGEKTEAELDCMNLFVEYNQ